MLVAKFTVSRATAKAANLAVAPGIDKMLAALITHGGSQYEHCRRTNRTGLHPERSKPERSEAFGFRGQEECGAGVLPVGLEPHLHERTRLLRGRHEGFRNVRRRGPGRKR